jgi:hypothetical protein
VFHAIKFKESVYNKRKDSKERGEQWKGKRAWKNKMDKIGKR